MKKPVVPTLPGKVDGCMWRLGVFIAVGLSPQLSIERVLLDKITEQPHRPRAEVLTCEVPIPAALALKEPKTVKESRQ